MSSSHVYFDSGCDEIIKNLERGELSKICQNALKEHDGYKPSIESLNKKIALLYEERKKIEFNIFQMENRLDDLKVIEIDKIEKELSEQQDKGKREDEIKNTHSLFL